MQNIFPDNTFTFDRRDSYFLTKKEFIDLLEGIRPAIPPGKYFNRRYAGNKNKPAALILLQACNTFWLFRAVLKFENQNSQIVDGFINYDKCIDYDLEFLAMWKNYEAERKLIQLSIGPDKNFWQPVWSFEKEQKKEDVIHKIIESLSHKKDAHLYKVLNSFRLYKDNQYEEKHIPILRDTGIGEYMNPLDLYLAIDEYFSKEKTESERTESVGITNNEKIINHGFNTKTSFRGKPKKD